MPAGKVVVGVADKNVYGEGVLRDGENVVLVALTDLMALAKRFTEILEDKPLQRIIGARARQTIPVNFSRDKICDQTMQAYHTVLRAIRTAWLGSNNPG